MYIVTRKTIIAVALAGASIAGGLASANAQPAPPRIQCYPLEDKCESCDEENVCEACDDWGCNYPTPIDDNHDYSVIICPLPPGNCYGCPDGQLCTECDQWGCGSNTAEVLGKKIGPLDLLGGSNEAGFSIDPVLHKGNKKYTLIIERGEIRGENNPSDKIVGTDLVGSSFRLHSEQPIGNRTSWNVKIQGVALVPLFALRSPPGGAQGNDVQYEFAFAYALELPDLTEYALKAVRHEYVCPEVSAWHWETHDVRSPMTWERDDSPHAGKTYQVLPWEQQVGRFAVLVKGETYDPDTATVAVTGSEGRPWFNIACAGTALSKMKLLGYDPEDTQYPTKWEQRQATLKMITARYCGSMSFTEAGQPLIWQNAQKWFRPLLLPWWLFPEPIGRVEAVWNKDGAVCLNKPRRTQSWTQREVNRSCPGPDIPTCDTLFPSPRVQLWSPFGPLGDPLRYVPRGYEWVTRHSVPVP